MVVKHEVYLFFEGECEAAFNFYKEAFGTEFQMISRFADMPPSADCDKPVPEECKNWIMHVSLPTGKDTALMGSDTAEHYGADKATKYTKGNNFSVSLATESKQEADALFAKLGEGGTVTMPLANTFWGSYFGSFTDKFGVSWMVSAPSTEAPPAAKEEE